MRVCLIADDHDAAPLADLLAAGHEVSLIRLAGRGDGWSRCATAREIVHEPSPELLGTHFASPEHLRSAGYLEAIEAAYDGGGPDYLEAAERYGSGLIPALARDGGHRLLRDTAIGVRLIGSSELAALHDADLGAPGATALCDLEREQLRLADWIVSPSDEGIDVYRRHYGAPLDPAVRIPLPQTLAAELGPAPAAEPGAPLRILYCGPLSRGRGAGDLAEACQRLGREGWELTMAGADTPTATFKQSMRLSIEEMFGADPRARVEGPLDFGERLDLMRGHDLFVAPARFELWGTEVLEAMSVGLPVIATPVGGNLEMVEEGVTGWLTGGMGAASLRVGIEEALGRVEEVRAVRASGAARARALRLTDPEIVAEGYARLLDGMSSTGAEGPAVSGREPEPLISAIVPYYLGAAHLEEALDSLFGQSHRNVEAIVVNDGSFEEEDEVLLRVAERPGVRVLTQLNAGEAAARNLGILFAEGEYLMMLDADNVLEPEFLERAVDVSRRRPDVAYVGCWLRFIDSDGEPYRWSTGCAHLGNRVMRGDSSNWDGDTLALVPRRLLTELGYFHDTEAAAYTDWEFYRRLREDGRFGIVIPERLARYRVRTGSLMRTWSKEAMDRSWIEARDRQIARETQWVGVPADGC